MTNTILVIVSLAVIYFTFRVYRGMKMSGYNANMESCVLRVAVSKLNERGPLVAEQIFAAIHGIAANYSTLDYLMGKPKPRLSFEIANVKNKIQFLIWTPKMLKNVIESQIYAQYPDVEIEEVEDYARQNFQFHDPHVVKKETAATSAPASATLPAVYKKPEPSKKMYAATAEMSLSGPHIYPIKRFFQFEDKLTRLATEPLAGITATLSKLNATDEQAWIQIVVQPLGDWWRKRAIKCLRIITNGLFSHHFGLKDFATNLYLARGFWKRLFLQPVYLFLWIFRGFRTGELKVVSRDVDLNEEVSTSHAKEDPVSSAVDKVTRLNFDVNLRLVYITRSENVDLAEVKINEIAGSFKQFSLPNMNSLKLTRINENNRQILNRYKQRLIVNPMAMSAEELATLYHLPNKDVGTPNVVWVTSRKLEPPHNLPLPGMVPDNELTLIGKANFRGHQQLFGIKEIDRRRHVYIIGKTGMGKSVLLENMIYSDVNSGKGIAVIDPHGDLAESVIDFVPSHRTNDVAILDPSDVSHPFAFNMLEYTEDANLRNLMASGLLGVFKKMYAESWGPRLEHILRNCLLALAEFPNTSILGIMRILVDKEYRRKVVDNISNPMVRSFWVDEFEKMQDKMRTEAISPIQNKVGQFLSSPLIRNIVGQVKSTVNIRFMMDSGKIIIINLSKGKIGEDNSSLLGSMLITKFQLDAMSRANIPEKDRTDFYLYVDEFQNFATDAFATILSEARKYKLNLTMANQYIAQMPDEVRDAVFGNVGTIITFQVGFDDAEYFQNQFSEEVLFNDIVTLPKYNCYSKLMIDGMPSNTFSIATLPPPKAEFDEGRREKIVRLSRERYCKPREVVEDKIIRWSQRLEDKERETDKLEAKEPKKLEPGKAGPKASAPAKTTADKKVKTEAKETVKKTEKRENKKS
jgi:hypothetical protein